MKSVSMAKKKIFDVSTMIAFILVFNIDGKKNVTSKIRSRYLKALQKRRDTWQEYCEGVTGS